MRWILLDFLWIIDPGAHCYALLPRMSSSHSFDNAIRVEAGTGTYYLGCRIGVERTSSMDCLGKILEPAGGVLKKAAIQENTVVLPMPCYALDHESAMEKLYHSPDLG